MREHSGHKNSNNDRNPTLRDAEKKKGVSGEAELEDVLADKAPSRLSTAKPGH